MEHGPAEPKQPRKLKINLRRGGSKVLRELQLDWRAYFRRFCEEHGEPVEEGGRLIFPDAWAYSCTDHKGPEWRPPEDKMERRAIKLTYWAKYSKIARAELAELEQALADLKQHMHARSVPLQRRVKRSWIVDEGSFGRMRPQGESVEDVRLDAVEGRIEWLKGELARAEETVKQINRGEQDVVSER